MKTEKRHERKIRNMILILVFTAVILSVSTYAWFIGMRTVNVSAFDVEIASTEDLMLSLNGEDWSDTVTISGDTFNTVSYTGNTNWWSGKGLSPVSSVGVIDIAASRLIMYEKASLTATDGGFRLMSSRVPNDQTSATEVNGYVAFDLFIKNSSGRQYIEELLDADEEAIYLDVNSAVTVSAAGVEGTGIENSVRVAFAQIGRVVATTDHTQPTELAKITGITCADVSGVVTGICTRNAQIWEPNDTKHVDGAIDWFDLSCKNRNTDGTYVAKDVAVACNTFADGSYKETWAVNDKIDSLDEVDVYDGHNTYESAKLTKMEYFTDTMKEKTGTNRPTFMTLAPNSITKVRIYVWIEGQDLDNYDFASIGKSIAVQFGFTKQRYTEKDINDLGIDPSAKPKLELTDANASFVGTGKSAADAMQIEVGTETVWDVTLDPGYDATDYVGDVIPSTHVSITENINFNKTGTYKVTYKATDPYTNVSVTAVRYVKIIPTP